MQNLINRTTETSSTIILNYIIHDLGTILNPFYVFRIPEGCLITFALTEVLNDPKHFPNPKKFEPERFLVTNPDTGKLVFKPHSALIPFGVGK